MTSTLDFVEVTIPPDTVPPDLMDVEYPCKGCGNEAGPYSGRGRKPVWCKGCKSGQRKSNPVKVTGNAANLASQAALTLGQLNGALCIGLLAVGMTDTASAIAANNDVFEERARQALLTDPDLCRMIMKGGVKSAKVSLAIAYAGLGMAVAPVAVAEIREKKAERDAKREAAENETGT